MAFLKKDSTIERLVVQGFAELENNHPEEAKLRADEGLSIEPNNVELLLLKSEIALAEQDVEEALDWIERGLALHPDHPGLCLQKASLLFDYYEDYGAAKALLIPIKTELEALGDELSQEGAESLLLDVYLLLIDCVRMEGSFAQALALAKKAKSLANEEPAALLALATAHFEVGEYKKGLVLIASGEYFEEDADFHWLKALIHCALEEFDKSEEHFFKAYKLDKSRYHRPLRLDKNDFMSSYSQALLSLPKDIRDHVNERAIKIVDVMPLSVVINSQAALSPTACVAHDHEKRSILIAQRNVENLATNRSQIKDVIASSLIHELSQLY